MTTIRVTTNQITGEFINAIQVDRIFDADFDTPISSWDTEGNPIVHTFFGVDWDGESNDSSTLESIGFDDNGEWVASKMICQKENCNCAGSWIDGNKDDVVMWIDRKYELA